MFIADSCHCSYLRPSEGFYRICEWDSHIWENTSIILCTKVSLYHTVPLIEKKYKNMFVKFYKEDSNFNMRIC
jgi:hypothetical protein